MSDFVLQRSKLLCYFQIDPSMQEQAEDIYKAITLPLTIYHFHYPALHYPTLFNHFQHYFPANASFRNVRIRYRGNELPSDLPLGLFVVGPAELQVTYSKWECVQGFKLMMVSWKKGYTIVNREGGCDHIFKKLNLQSQMELYNLHLKGCSHGLHTIPKYEGNAIALRLVIADSVLERMESNLSLTVQSYLLNQFGTPTKDYQVYTHNVKIDSLISLKELLQDWNYNDGYCYLKLVQR